MPKVTFVKERKTVEVPAGSNLRQVMMANGIPVYRGFDNKANCGGRGSCGTCRVYIKDGEDNASKKGLKETLRTALAFFTIGHEHECRLSCQTQVNGDMTIEATPDFNWWGDEVKYITRPCE